MDIVTELIKHFHMELNGESAIPNTIRNLPQSIISMQGTRLFSIIKKMEQEGLLHYVANTGRPIIDNQYVSFDLDPNMLNYGGYDNLIFGFPATLERFTSSVLPVIVTRQDDDLGIGTCFLTIGDLIITARHCIEGFKNVLITDDDGKPIEPEYIISPSDPNMDIAYIKLRGTPLKRKALEFMPGNILDEVLTLGYPPIPTFDAVQIADIAAINTKIKVSSGRITGKGNDYMNNDEYLLLNARVKGGNSGGPVINKYGKVVGMIVRLPTDDGEIDKLGYGVAVPSETITQLFNLRNVAQSVVPIPFKMGSGGFSTC